jgi:hypothetical protein
LIRLIIKHLLNRCLIAGFSFLIFFPLFIFIFKPYKDISYHLGKTIDISDKSLIKNNIYYDHKGKIEIEELFFLKNGIISYDGGIFFRLKEYPSNIYFLVNTEMDINPQLNKQIEDKDELSLLNRVMNKEKGKGNISNEENDKIISGFLMEEISKKTLSGRVYSSDGIFRNFDSLNIKCKDSFIDRININKEIKIKPPSYFDFLPKLFKFNDEVNESEYFIVYTDEKPSLQNLFRLTNFPVILIGFILGIVTFIFLLRSMIYKSTPLIRSIHKGNTAKSLYYINKKLYISKKDSINNSPLHYAAAYNQTVIVEALLDEKVNIYEKGVENLTPIHFAIAEESMDTFNILFKSVEYDKLELESGITLLDYAFINGSSPIIEKLINQENWRKSIFSKDNSINYKKVINKKVEELINYYNKKFKKSE